MGSPHHQRPARIERSVYLLKELRRAGFSTEDFARWAAKAPQTVRRWETGYSPIMKPAYDAIRETAEAYGIAMPIYKQYAFGPFSLKGMKRTVSARIQRANDDDQPSLQWQDPPAPKPNGKAKTGASAVDTFVELAADLGRDERMDLIRRLMATV